MTIGIALEYGKNENLSEEGIIFIGDKMVSTGNWAVELPSAKLAKLCSKSDLKVYALGSGDVSNISKFIRNLRVAIENDGMTTVHEVAEKGTDVYNESIRMEIEKTLLSPYGFEIKDVLMSKDANDTFVDDFLYRSRNKRSDLYGQLGILIAGVDKYGAHIYKIEEGSYSDAGRLHFDTIGSGSESADWTLMHSYYDPSKDLDYSLMLGMMAKIQAEESMGVGSNTDAISISIESNGIGEIKPETLSYIRKVFRSENKRQKLRLDNNIIKLRQFRRELNENEKGSKTRR